MKVFVIEPIGKKSDWLFSTMNSCFEFVSSVSDAKYVFYDCWCGWGEYNRDDVRETISLNKPVAVFDFHDYNDRIEWQGHKKWANVFHEDWAYCLTRLIGNDCVKVYFMRKMSGVVNYPSFVKPIEHIIQNEYPIVSKEELINREYDFCWIGNTSPERQNVVNGLLGAGFKGYVHWTNENGKISHDEWVRLHSKSKLFLTADGGGYSDERAYQLFTISPMLKQKNNHFQLYPFQDGHNSIQINEKPTRFDIEDLQVILSEPETLYSIYLNGIEYMRKHYSAESRANYILNILNQNTVLDAPNIHRY